MKRRIFLVFKILASLLLILVIINRGKFVTIYNPILREVTNWICGTIGVISILQAYLSIIALSDVREAEKERSRTNVASMRYKEYFINDVILLVTNNDIIDIRIIAQNKVIAIGTSSECDTGSSTFYGKLYYIDNNTFEDIEIFKTQLLSISQNQPLKVTAIDDVPIDNLI